VPMLLTALLQLFWACGRAGRAALSMSFWFWALGDSFLRGATGLFEGSFHWRDWLLSGCGGHVVAVLSVQFGGLRASRARILPSAILQRRGPAALAYQGFS